MADVLAVSDMIEEMVDGFEPQVLQCLRDNADIAEKAVREQLYGGIDGNGEYLNPSYDNDPYFEEKGNWYHQSQAYKQWKERITPPIQGTMLLIAPRPASIPNLFINGKFHSEIFSTMDGDTLRVSVKEIGDGPDIVDKYGEQILKLSPTAIGYFNFHYIEPHIWQFFADCGYEPET